MTVLFSLSVVTSRAVEAPLPADTSSLVQSPAAKPETTPQQQQQNEEPMSARMPKQDVAVETISTSSSDFDDVMPGEDFFLSGEEDDSADFLGDGVQDLGTNAGGGYNLRGSVTDFVRSFWDNATTAEGDTTGTNNLTIEGSACVGQAGWDADFANRLFGCGMRHLGVMPGCGRCMARRQRVSQACGACLGRLISCGKGCIWQCCAGRCLGRRACARCNERKCVPSFRACSGVEPPTSR